MATPPIVVDPKIWREIAGPFVQFPTLNAEVYYIPQGHIEEATIPPTITNLSPLILQKSCIPCIIKSLQYLADPITEDIFAQLTLQPVPSHPTNLSSFFLYPPGLDNPISFPKRIDISDKPYFGEFAIPKQLADAMFPPLKKTYYYLNPPVPYRAYGQNLEITDLCGMTWKFDHIYRLEDDSHWVIFSRQLDLGSLFSVSKNLVQGDTIIFVMIPTTRKLLVGIRRREKKKVTLESVSKALELAVNDKPFELVYYPNPPSVGWADFVVRAEVLQQRMSMNWEMGMVVWFPLEIGSNASHGVVINKGVVTSVLANTKAWENSPWRMLQVDWDIPMAPTFDWVCPWQVNPFIPLDGRVKYLSSPPPKITWNEIPIDGSVIDLSSPPPKMPWNEIPIDGSVIDLSSPPPKMPWNEIPIDGSVIDLSSPPLKRAKMPSDSIV